jgi:hypothetical protein
MWDARPTHTRTSLVWLQADQNVERRVAGEGCQYWCREAESQVVLYIALILRFSWLQRYRQKYRQIEMRLGVEFACRAPNAASTYAAFINASTVVLCALAILTRWVVAGFALRAHLRLRISGLRGSSN